MLSYFCKDVRFKRYMSVENPCQEGLGARRVGLFFAEQASHAGGCAPTETGAVGFE